LQADLNPYVRDKYLELWRAAHSRIPRVRRGSLPTPRFETTPSEDSVAHRRVADYWADDVDGAGPGSIRRMAPPGVASVST
jgi:hypothetical protein